MPASRHSPISTRTPPTYVSAATSPRHLVPRPRLYLSEKGINTNYFNTATYFPISIWTVVELNVGVVAACMPAARLFVAKTAGDIAKSTGFTRFSESARPSYSHSGRSSGYAKRRSARAAAAAAAARRGGDSLPTTTSCTAVSMHDFGDSTTITCSREEGEETDHYQTDLEIQRPDDASNMELVEVESRISDLKAMG